MSIMPNVNKVAPAENNETEDVIETEKGNKAHETSVQESEASGENEIEGKYLFQAKFFMS